MDRMHTPREILPREILALGAPAGDGQRPRRRVMVGTAVAAVVAVVSVPFTSAESEAPRSSGSGTVDTARHQPPPEERHWYRLWQHYAHEYARSSAGDVDPQSSAKQRARDRPTPPATRGVRPR
jgi:hypothetical protein